MMLVQIVFAVFPPFAFSAPAQVILIRHGEKPPSGNELNDQGRQRALALVKFFETNPTVTKFGTPVSIYAMCPKGPDGSLRPIETVTPLARDLKININENFLKNETKEIVSDIMNNSAYNGKMILICWEHKAIPSIVSQFGWNPTPDWPGGDVFDRVWILNFTGNRVTSFQDIPQHLLPGDSSN
ncbi:MAG: histidine phosphatase family protein [Candidatus Riflebacteria bacterium]|nr:histidine phosphatase family protein [Candidatus Riflebacteria bacterium]